MKERRRRVTVLGCGLVGEVIARDLARDGAFEVIAVDANADRLARVGGGGGGDGSVRCVRADLSDPHAIRRLAGPADVAVGALPSRLGFAALRAVIESGTPYCDISFMVEDPSELDPLARKLGVAAVVDCGVAPGLANMVIGCRAGELDRVDDVVYYVGGLPRERVGPYEYKAPFAPADVIEEYLRPARLVVDGKVVVKAALSDVEPVEFPGIGTLEGFLTDGLRSLLSNVPARNMREKTLRYPGHAERIRLLRETGLFSREEISVAGVRVRPFDVAKALLFPLWKLDDSDEEFTVLRVIVEGRTAEGRARRYLFELHDERDPLTGEHSMARSTAFPCTQVARMLADGTFRRPGVHGPEILGREPGLLERVVAGLADRGIRLRDSMEESSAPDPGSEGTDRRDRHGPGRSSP